MNEALASLAATEGVRGVIVFDADGNCVANDLPAPCELGLMAEAVKHIARMFDVFASMEDGAVNSFSANCDGGSIVLRHAAPHTIVALTTPNVNLSVLNVALNVAARNLMRKQSGTRLQVEARPVFDTLANRSSPMLPQRQADPGEQIPSEAVDDQVVVELTEVYGSFLGPAAKPVLKQQLLELGVTAYTLRWEQFPDLVARLAQRIPSARRQKEFVAAAQALAQRHLAGWPRDPAPHNGA